MATETPEKIYQIEDPETKAIFKVNVDPATLSDDDINQIVAINRKARNRNLEDAGQKKLAAQRQANMPETFRAGVVNDPVWNMVTGGALQTPGERLQARRARTEAIKAKARADYAKSPDQVMQETADENMNPFQRAVTGNTPRQRAVGKTMNEFHADMKRQGNTPWTTALTMLGQAFANPNAALHGETSSQQDLGQATAGVNKKVSDVLDSDVGTLLGFGLRKDLKQAGPVGEFLYGATNPASIVTAPAALAANPAAYVGEPLFLPDSTPQQRAQGLGTFLLNVVLPIAGGKALETGVGYAGDLATAGRIGESVGLPRGDVFRMAKDFSKTNGIGRTQTLRTIEEILKRDPEAFKKWQASKATGAAPSAPNTSAASQPGMLGGGNPSAPAGQTVTIPPEGPVPTQGPNTPPTAQTPAESKPDAKKPAKYTGADDQAPKSAAFTPAGSKVDVVRRVVERDSITSSHNHEGKPNSDYPQEFQPRDRSTPNYMAQVKDRAKNLDPDLVTMDFKATDRGAPVVDPSGNVISGNGRTMSIDVAKVAHPDRYKAYRDAVVSEFPEAANMKDPRIVQELATGAEGLGSRDVAKQSNEGSSDVMPAHEKAYSYADLLPHDVESRFDFTGRTLDDAVNSAGNRSIVSEFANKLPDSLRTAVFDLNGDLSIEGRKLIGQAIMARALGPGAKASLSKFYSEGDFRRSVVSGLEQSSPSLLKLASEAKTNPIAGEVRDAVVKALDYVDQAQNTKNPRAWFDQGSLESREPGAIKLARAMVEARSSSQVAEVIHRAATAATDSSGGMFEDELSFKSGDEAVGAAFSKVSVAPDGGLMFADKAKGGKAKRNETVPNSSKNSTRAKTDGTKSGDGSNPTVRAENPGANQNPAPSVDGTQKATRGSFNKEQIQIAPIKGADPTNILNPMVALNNLLGKRLLEAKQAKRHRGAAGYYQPTTGATTVVSVNNLATAAHEISHALDDRYKLGESLAYFSNQGGLTPIGQELDWFKQRGGSGNPTIQNLYDVEEARAEFLKSYLFNPDAARAQAPLYSAYFERVVSRAIMKDIKIASDAIRQWGGLTAAGKMQAQIRTKAPGKGKRAEISPEDYKTSTRAKVEQSLTDELAPVRDAVHEAINRGGRAPAKPSEDPIELLRAYGYIGNKIDTILSEGMINFHTADQVAGFTKGGFSRILEPLDRTSNKAFEADLSRAEAYITAQSVVEDWETRWNETVDAALAEIHAGLLAADPKFSPGDWTRWQNDPANQAQIRKIVRDAKKAASRQMKDYTGASKMMGNDIVDARRTIREIERSPEDLKRYRKFALRYRQWAKAVIRYMVDAGRLSSAQGSAIMARSKYAAINRVFDEVPGETFRTGGVTRGKNPIKGRTGSTRTIESPVKNLIMQTAKAVAEADRNDALLQLTKVFTGTRTALAEDATSLDAIAHRGDEGAKNGIVVYRNGVPETWVFEEGVADSLNQVGKLDSNSFVTKVFSFPARVLRQGVTLAPSFVVRNKIRDLQQALFLSTAGANAWDHLVSNQFVGTNKFTDEEKRLYRLFGGGIANERFLKRVDDYYDTRGRIAESIVKAKRGIIVDAATRAGIAYSEFLESLETSTRLVEFRKSLETASDALDTTGWTQKDFALFGTMNTRALIDFTTGGTITKAINRFVPFTNAAVQGSRATFRAAQRDPIGFARRVILGSLAASVFVYGWNKARGQEAIDAYRELPPYYKDFFYPLYVANGQFIFIPKPYDLGVLASWMTRALVATEPKGAGIKEFEGCIDSSIKAMVPMDTQNLSSLGPKVMLEIPANYSFFKNDNIVPSYESKLFLKDRKGAKNASRIGKIISTMSEYSPNPIDPRMVDHALRSTFGNLGAYALAASDVGSERQLSVGRGVGLLLGVSNEVSPMTENSFKKVMDIKERLGVQGNPFGVLMDKYYAAKTDDEKKNVSIQIREVSQSLLKQIGNVGENSSTADRIRAKRILSRSPYTRKTRRKTR
jgi:hypothetical protein